VTTTMRSVIAGSRIDGAGEVFRSTNPARLADVVADVSLGDDGRGEDPTVQRRQRHVDAGRPQVGDEDVAGIGPEAELARRSTTGARPDIALGDEPALDQLTDPTDDDRPAETGPVAQLRPGSRATEADLVEDENERVQRLVGQWPSATGSKRQVIGHAGIIRRSTWCNGDFCT